MGKSELCISNIQEVTEIDVKWICDSLKHEISNFSEKFEIATYTDVLGIEHIQMKNIEPFTTGDCWEFNEYSDDVFPLEAFDTSYEE